MFINVKTSNRNRVLFLLGFISTLGAIYLVSGGKLPERGIPE